jgi:hypothetical protein
LSFGEGWSVGGEGVGGGGERWWTYHVDVLMIWLRKDGTTTTTTKKGKGTLERGGDGGSRERGADTEMGTN